MSPTGSHEEIRRQLLGATAEVHDREQHLAEHLASVRHLPPRPGDLYVFASPSQTKAGGIEWLVVERSAADPPRLWVVPADTHPLVGSRDVHLGPEELGGPLCLRAGEGLWLPEEAFAAASRSGYVEERVVEAVRARQAAPSLARLQGSPLAQEVDDESEMQDWLDEVVRPARATLLEVASARPSREGRGTVWRQRPLQLLAASLVAALLGVGYWGVAQRRQGEEPRLLGSLQQVDLGPLRGEGEPVWLEPGRDLLLGIALPSDLDEEGEIEIEIFNERSRRTWSQRLPTSSREPELALPRATVAVGDRLVVRLYQGSGPGRVLLREVPVHLRSRSPAGS